MSGSLEGTALTSIHSGAHSPRQQQQWRENGAEIFCICGRWLPLAWGLILHMSFWYNESGEGSSVDFRGGRSRRRCTGRGWGHGPRQRYSWNDMWVSMCKNLLDIFKEIIEKWTLKWRGGQRSCFSWWSKTKWNVGSTTSLYFQIHTKHWVHQFALTPGADPYLSLCIVLHHLFSLPVLPSLADSTSRGNIERLGHAVQQQWGVGALCSSWWCTTFIISALCPDWWGSF